MIGETEPSAAHRQWSANLRQAFVALVQQGFTEDQALQLVGTAMIAGSGSS